MRNVKFTVMTIALNVRLAEFVSLPVITMNFVPQFRNICKYTGIKFRIKSTQHLFIDRFDYSCK